MRDTFNENQVKDRGEAINKQFKELLDCLRIMPKAKPEEKKQRLEWMKSRPEYDTFEMEVINVWNNRSASIKEAQVDLTALKKSIQLAIEEYTGISKKGKSYTFFQSVEQIYKKENFDVQFKEFFDCLRVMPKGNARLEWMKSRPESDALKIEVIKLWNPEGYNKFTRVQNERYIGTTFDADDGIETTINTETSGKRNDSEVIMETFNKAIENFTGINESGKTYTFFQSMGQIYNQKAMEHSGKNDFQKAGISTEGENEKELYLVLQMEKILDKLAKNNNMTKEDAFEWLISTGKLNKFTKKQIKLLKDRVRGLRILSLNAKISNEDENAPTYEQQLEDKKDAFEEMEMQDMLNSLFERTTNFDKKWKIVEASVGKREREIIKAFLAKDILIALKLEFVDEEKKKIYKDLLEPKCKKWCPRSNCIYKAESEEKSSKRTSCFIRYGDREFKYRQEGKLLTDIIRGDQQVYDLLEKMGTSFYETILNNSYVKKAYTEKVENYNDLFCKKLKPAKGVNETEIFQFTDTILGNALGERKDTISKCRIKYKTDVRPTLYKIFKEVME